MLSIYKASAGSGKTFRLTLEYLKLILLNPKLYRNILAVTFTNKATEEMKGRIVNVLYELSVGKNKSYRDKICEETGIPEKEIPLKAKECLSLILHDYSHFKISTIDSFFQEVLRVFVREIGLQSGYNLELDSGRVLSESIDQLLVEIDSKPTLKNWLTQFAENKINEGKAWNFKSNIVDFGNQIFKEEYKLFNKETLDKLQDKNFLTDYQNTLKLIINEFEGYLEERAKKALEIIEEHSLIIDDFAYGASGVTGYFLKLADKSPTAPGVRASEAVDAPDKWYTKKSTNIDAIVAAYNAGLNSLLRDSIEFFNLYSSGYYSALKIINYFYSLGILTDIATEVSNYSVSNNVFLISDSSQLLSGIIAGNETPFIYEKYGNNFSHYMIDEFQDTSRIQWSNFMPLLKNSVAQGQNCLIVGDVKQSIYRWRNSDWKLLGGEVLQDFFPEQLSQHTLGVNWRSFSNVIHFNNTFFTEAAKTLQAQFNEAVISSGHSNIDQLDTMITGAYSDIIQKTPEIIQKEGGYVKMKLINHEDISYDEAILPELKATIEELQEKNIRAGEIAILVRNKKEGKIIADYLLTCDNKKEGILYDIISAESLYISSSAAIRLAIDTLKYSAHPEELVTRTNIIFHHRQLFGNEDSVSTIHEYVGKSDWYLEVLPDLHEFKERIINLPLNEQVEETIKYLKLNTIQSEIPYLLAFQELISEYSRNQQPDLFNFLNWWAEDGLSKSIALPEGQEAIRILTIHKSKGLEFRAVLVPYCNWKLDHDKETILWCSTQTEPFNSLDFIPVRYAQDLSETVFYKQYFTEMLQTYVDNLNLLYVAFTRAEEILVAFSGNSKEIKKISTTSQLIKKIVEAQSGNNPEHTISLESYWDNESQCLSIGNPEFIAGNSEEDDTALRMKEYPSARQRSRVSLRPQSTKRFEESDAVLAESRNYGIRMHNLLSKVNEKSDISSALQQVIIEGLANSDEISEMENRIKNYLQQNVAAEWFDKSWTSINEKAILLKNGVQLRPDRVIVKDKQAVVIDYKFTEEEKESHKRQVAYYMALIKKMGYEEVTGYIWYPDKEKTVQVQPSG